MRARYSTVATVLVGALGLAGVASAQQKIYDYTSGDVVITSITVNGTGVLQNSPFFNMGTGSTATIDTTADTLQFSFSQAASPPFVGDLQNTVGGINFTGATLDLSNVTLASPSGTSLTLTPQGSGGYTFAALSGIMVGGSYDLTIPSVSFNSGTKTFAPKSESFSGAATVMTAADTLEIDGLTLGTWTIDGQQVSAIGNVIFDGAPVPLPGTLLLLGSGLGLLTFSFARRKRSKLSGA
jgi:PEP-CTERM motif